MDEIVERGDIVLLEKIPKFFIAAHTEVSIVLLLDSTHVSVIAFVAQLTVLVARSVAVHSWSVGCHTFMYEGCLKPSLLTPAHPPKLGRCEEPASFLFDQAIQCFCFHRESQDN